MAIGVPSIYKKYSVANLKTKKPEVFFIENLAAFYN
jgi:hypothetical protein